jgi:hypothetical protein
MADRSIEKREQYVGYATHCLQLAKATTDRESRAILREMATEWLKLAEGRGVVLPSGGLFGSAAAMCIGSKTNVANRQPASEQPYLVEG